MSKETYYEEGNKCPECGGMVIITQCRDTGRCSIKCQKCYYDVSYLEK